MSNAKPVHPEARGLNYGYPLTPRQLRRYWKKSNRLEDDYIPVYDDCPAAERSKGRPTARRSAARAAMLERRRG